MLCFCCRLTSAQTVDFTRSKKEGCAPLSSVNFTDQSSGDSVVNRKWDLGNGRTVDYGNKDRVGANYLHPGTYTVMLTATFENGKTKSKSKKIVVHPNPVAEFTTSDTLGCAPLKAHFEDLSTTDTGTITDWEWHFGEGTSTDQEPEFTFNKPGSYDVTLFVKNNWGCRSDATIKQHYIKTLALPDAGFTSALPSPCQEPLKVNFKNTTSGSGNIHYQWDFGDGSAGSTVDNPSHTYVSPGTYTVSMTATVGEECQKTVTSEIRVGTPTSSFVHAPEDVCNNEKVALEGKATPESKKYQYSWKFEDDGSMIQGEKVTHYFKQAGDYKVDFITSSQNGCSDTVSKIIHVHQSPRADFSADQSAGCSTPYSVQFTSQTSPSTGLTYKWDFGDGDTSSAPNPSHVYRSGGPFTVKLTVTNNAVDRGCSYTVTKKDFIEKKLPKVAFSLDYTEGCTSFPVQTKAKISNLQGGADKLVWDWGDGFRDTVTFGELTAQHVYSDTGRFTIVLTLVTADKCMIESASKSVHVVGKCDDDGSPYNNVGDHVTNGGIGDFVVGKTCENKYKVTLTDTVKNTKVVSWNFGDGNQKTTGTLNPVTHIFPASGEKYEVTVKRKNLNTGIISTNTKNVIIIDEKADFSPNMEDVCRTQKVHFYTKGIDSSKIKRYIWNFGDGAKEKVIHNINHYKAHKEWLNGDVSHKYTKNGLYHAKLIIEDKMGCRDSFEYPVSIEVRGPTVGFTATHLNSCDPTQKVTFTDTSKQDGSTSMVKWEWDFGDDHTTVSTHAGATVSHTYQNTSFYNHRTVELTVTDANGCSITAKKKDLIKGYRPAADFETEDTLVCGSAKVKLKNTSKAKKATYLWSYGDGATSTEKKGTHVYDKLGSYDVSLKVVDEGGCKDSVLKKDYIQKIAPVAAFELDDTAKCAPTGIQIMNKSKFGKSWKWDFGDGKTSTEKDPQSHFYDKPGYYTIKLVVSSVDGCTSTAERTLRVRGPIATITTERNAGCKPFDLQARVTGEFIDTYAWDFRDGTTVHDNTKDSVISHTYTQAGEYKPNVILTAPGKDGCSFEQELEQPVFVDSIHTDFAIQENFECDSTKVSLVNLSITPAFSSVTDYKWDFDDGTTTSLQSTPSPHTLGPGNYHIALMTQSQYGCRDTAVRSLSVQAYTPPTVDFDGALEGCRKEEMSFTASVHSPDGIEGYLWKVDGEVVGRQEKLSYAFQSSGSHHLSLLVTSPKGCETVKEKQVVIHALPETMVSSDTTICIGTTIRLHAAGGTAYQWTPSAGLQDTQTASPTAAPEQTTEYNVKVTNGFGCAKWDSVRVQVDQKMDLQYDARPTVCRGSVVDLSVSGNASQYVWTPSSGLNQTTGAQVKAGPDQSTEYQVVGMSGNACPNDTGMIHLTVLDTPTVHLIQDTNIVAGTKTSIPIQTTGNIVHYTWSPSRGLNCTHCKNPHFIADHDIVYKATVTMDNGCKATDEMKVHVLCNGGKVYIPTAFTPNDDGNNDVFYISGYGITIKHFAIFDRWGKKVFEKKNIQAGDKSQGWRGIVNNEKVRTTTTFVYKAEIECVGGEVFPVKGYVVLIR